MKLLSFLGLSLIIIIHFIFILANVALFINRFKPKASTNYGLNDKFGIIMWVWIITFSILLSFYITYVF
jgi:hypothetical protein